MKDWKNYVFVVVSAVGILLVATMYPRFSYEPDFAQKEDFEGVENFARLTKDVWRGQAPDAKGIENLKKAGVKTIIDFRSNDEHEGLSEDLEINYVRMPFRATDPPPTEYVEKFLEITKNPDMLPVFFHCRHGKDRTGTMAALYRVRVQGWEPEKALNEMKYFGFRTFYRDLANFIRSQKPAGIEKK